jgi:hypothetical protein
VIQRLSCSLLTSFGALLHEQQDGKSLPRPEVETKPTYKLPPTSAIAGVLTRDWATDDVAGWGGAGSEAPKPTPTVEPRL